MASGITPNQECLSVFQNLKISGRQGKEKPRFVIYKIGKDVDTKEDKIVVETVVTEKEIEEKGKSQSSYEFFISHLPRDEPRWAVYDFEFEKEGAGKRNKLVFYHWAPEGEGISVSKRRLPMMYASSRDALRKALVGIQVEIQATEDDEVAYETVLEKANKGS